MDYSNYRAEELAVDSTFRRWVMQPDQETDQFWIGLLREQPQQVATVVRAIQLVRQLNQVTAPELSAADTDQIEAIWQSIRSRIEREADKPLPVGRSVRFNAGWGRWAAAACIVLALGVAWWFSRQGSAQLIGDNELLTATANGTQQEAFNNTANPMPIKLSDGSLVRLQPNGRLRYAKQFAANKREVYLKGEAFFEVTKNSARPFLVFAGGTVTKVVGTSFQVRAYEQDKTVSVVVRTGRVSVFTQRNFARFDSSSTTQVAGVVLTPNQRATFERESEQLVKDLIERPLLVPSAPFPQTVNFDDRPVSEVLMLLEKQYGLDIIFDAQILSHCPITTTLSASEGLYQRLDRICRAIGASYEVVDGQLIITSTGCNY